MHLRPRLSSLSASLFVLCALSFLTVAPGGRGQVLSSTDLSKFRSIGGLALSPDGHRIAYTIVRRDQPGRPHGPLWIMDVSTLKSSRVGGEKDSGGGPEWSADGKWLAFQGSQDGKHGLLIARADGSDIPFLA